MSRTVAAEADRERFPEIEASIGEDPADVLDRDVIERGPKHTSKTARPQLVARIRGIDYLGVVNAWIQVERALDRGPREPVMELLERRRDWLLENGDRDDRLDGERTPAAPKDAVWFDEDGEVYDRSTSATSKIAQMDGGQAAESDGGRA